jgi:hypothetical protein
MPTDLSEFMAQEAALIWLFLFIAVWELVWKGFALLRAARNGNRGWFVLMMLFNTAGILPIAYIIGHPPAKEQPQQP